MDDRVALLQIREFGEQEVGRHRVDAQHRRILDGDG